MKKLLILASAAAAVIATPAMAAGEGRVEGRGAIGWGGGSEDFFAGVAAGYDIDLGETAFVGPEVSYDTNFDGADLVNVGGGLGAKVGEKGKLYGSVTSQEISDALLSQHQIEMDRRKIELPEPIRNAGDSQVTISLYAGVKVTMTVHVTAIR